MFNSVMASMLEGIERATTDRHPKLWTYFLSFFLLRTFIIARSPSDSNFRSIRPRVAVYFYFMKALRYPIREHFGHLFNTVYMFWSMALIDEDAFSRMAPLIWACIFR